MLDLGDYKDWIDAPLVGKLLEQMENAQLVWRTRAALSKYTKLYGYEGTAERRKELEILLDKLQDEKNI